MHHPKYLIGTLFQEQQLNKKQNKETIKNKDPNGNTRWQGAFTGGFSAGYRNTCGSKQGWQPAQFVSSMSNRAKKTQQNVLNFMDKEDLGRESLLGGNIQINNSFKSSQKSQNPFNISLSLRQEESIGSKILSKLKKNQVQSMLPQNQQDLDKLLKYYEQEQKLQTISSGYVQRYNLQDIQKPFSVGAQLKDFEQIDQFIQAYEQFYRKVIRAGIKEETQEEIKKRRQQNKVYFDFTKPIQEQPEYLKQIHEIEETLNKPKKRRRNILNQLRLKDLFVQGASFKSYNTQAIIQKAPQDYDPYHRIKQLKDHQIFTTNKISNPQKQQQQQKPRHRIHNIQQRSDILGVQRLQNKFKSASTNSFVHGDSKKFQQIKKYFIDQKKNQRYKDYVDELEGKRIVSSQNQYMTFQEIQKEKQQFQKMYKKQKQEMKNNKLNAGDGYKKLPSQLEKVLGQNVNINDENKINVIRTVKSWRPQRTLCKRFGFLLPYKIDQKNDQSLEKIKSQKKSQYF